MAYPPQFYEYRLTMEVDPGLQSRQHYAGAVNQVIQRPPGVCSLGEWGAMVIPSGKFQGKSYEEAAQDDGYVNQIWNRRAVSAWLRSFQMYARARRQAEAEWSRQQQQVIKPGNQNQGLMPTPKAMSPVKMPSEDAPWVKVNMEPAPSPSKPKAGSPETMKRRQPEESSSSVKAMQTTPDPDRINQIQAQIAVLQRELARATAVEDPREETQ